jgi:hypothetical protein
MKELYQYKYCICTRIFAAFTIFPIRCQPVLKEVRVQTHILEYCSTIVRLLSNSKSNEAVLVLVRVNYVRKQNLIRLKWSWTIYWLKANKDKATKLSTGSPSCAASGRNYLWHVGIDIIGYKLVAAMVFVPHRKNCKPSLRDLVTLKIDTSAF